MLEVLHNWENIFTADYYVGAVSGVKNASVKNG